MRNEACHKVHLKQRVTGVILLLMCWRPHSRPKLGSRCLCIRKRMSTRTKGRRVLQVHLHKYAGTTVCYVPPHASVCHWMMNSDATTQSCMSGFIFEHLAMISNSVHLSIAPSSPTCHLPMPVPDPSLANTQHVFHRILFNNRSWAPDFI